MIKHYAKLVDKYMWYALPAIILIDQLVRVAS